MKKGVAMQEAEKLKLIREKMQIERAMMTQSQRLQNLIEMVKNAEAYAKENKVEMVAVDVDGGEV